MQQVKSLDFVKIKRCLFIQLSQFSNKEKFKWRDEY